MDSVSPTTTVPSAAPINRPMRLPRRRGCVIHPATFQPLMRCLPHSSDTMRPAQAYRDALQGSGRATLDVRYGERARNRFDLFGPEGRPKGLVVFVHGGFWKALDKSFWSHLARGSVEGGYAVAMPSYTLCPT